MTILSEKTYATTSDEPLFVSTGYGAPSYLTGSTNDPTAGIWATTSSLRPKPIATKQPRRESQLILPSISPYPTIVDLGWTREYAAEVRAALSSFADEWDDAGMSVYDEP